MSDLENLINDAFEKRSELSIDTDNQEIRNAVNSALGALNDGSMRVAEKQDGEWVVNEWLKKAVLLSFVLNDNHAIEGGNCLSVPPVRHLKQPSVKFAG